MRYETLERILVAGACITALVGIFLALFWV
jgi:hypothetical protein